MFADRETYHVFLSPNNVFIHFPLKKKHKKNSIPSSPSQDYCIFFPWLLSTWNLPSLSTLSVCGILKSSTRNCQYQAQVVVRLQGKHLTLPQTGKKENTTRTRKQDGRWSSFINTWFYLDSRYSPWSLLRVSDKDRMVETKDRGTDERQKGTDVCRPTRNQALSRKYYISYLLPLRSLQGGC